MYLLNIEIMQPDALVYFLAYCFALINVYFSGCWVSNNQFGIIFHPQSQSSGNLCLIWHSFLSPSLFFLLGCLSFFFVCFSFFINLWSSCVYASFVFTVLFFFLTLHFLLVFFVFPPWFVLFILIYYNFFPSHTFLILFILLLSSDTEPAECFLNFLCCSSTHVSFCSDGYSFDTCISVVFSNLKNNHI